MSLDTMFTFELVLVALVLGGALASAIYIGLHHRRIRRQTGRLVGTADIAVGLPVGLTPDELARGDGGKMTRIAPGYWRSTMMEKRSRIEGDKCLPRT